MPRTRTRMIIAQLLLGSTVVGSSVASAAPSTPKSLAMRKAKPAKKKPVRTAQQPDPAPTPTPTPTPTPDVPPEEQTPPVEEPPPPPPPPEDPTPVEPTPPVEGVVEGEVEAETEEGPVELTPEELALLKEQEEAAGEVIVVTGSAFERRELTTPAPVTVLDRSDLDSAGMATVGDILQNLPAQSNAINIQFNNGGDGSTRVNLRGLGTARTLVLMNGRRIVPGGTGADASVDLNAIPLAVIERVEVLKDGASALYGSDAMGGVVNIITRSDFEGAEANFYTGMSQRGDGVAFDASFVNGAKWKKGNIVFAAGYSDLRPVWAGDREFSKAQRILDFAAADTDGDGRIGNSEEAAAVIDAGSSATPDGFLIWDDGNPDPGNNAFADLQNDCPSSICTLDPETGEWRDFNFGDESGANDFFNFQPDNYLITPLKRYNVFSQGNYELREGMRAFFEAQYMNRSSDQSLASEPVFLDQIGVAISADSIYNPFGRDMGFYRRRLQEMGRRQFFQEVDTFRTVTGLDGQLPDDLPALKNWKWEVSYNFGRTNATQRNQGSLIRSHLANALGPSMMDAGGTPICVSTPGDETTAIPDCVPLDILGGASSNGGAGSITEDMARYLTFTGVTSGFNEQQTALATMRGQLAKTPWGGDVSLAIGADYRVESGQFTPDPLTATGDTTGNAIEPIGGEYDVREGFAELSLVPVIDRGIAEWVELDLALRAFDYQSFGSGMTYKVGGLFRAEQGIALRGTYSTAFRAPSIGELFSGTFDDFPSLTDPCDTSMGAPTDPQTIAQCAEELGALGIDPATFQNPVQQIRTEVGGNPELQEETAKIFTAGIVIEPKPVKGLSLTIDYWNFAIVDAIQPVGADIIMQNCYQRRDQESCAKVIRRSNGVIDHLSDVADNIGANDTSGIDFAIAYDHSRPFGRLRHQLEATYLLTYEDTQANGDVFNGVGVYDLGVNPRIKANFATMWAKGGWNAGLNIRYIHKMKECDGNFCFFEDDPANPDDAPPIERDVDRNITADLFGGYALKSSAGTTTLGVGINNILDQNPPKIYNGFLAESDAATYDYLGRYYYFRVSQLF